MSVTLRNRPPPLQSTLTLPELRARRAEVMQEMHDLRKRLQDMAVRRALLGDT